MSRRELLQEIKETSTSNLTANPEKMGIQLDDDTCLNMSEGSRHKIAADDLTLGYHVARPQEEKTYGEEEEKNKEVQYFAKETKLAKPKADEKDNGKRPIKGDIIRPTNYSVGGRNDDVSTIGGFEDEYAWDDTDNSTIATSLTMRREENSTLGRTATIIEEDEEEESEEEEPDLQKINNDFRQSAYTRQNELESEVQGGHIETSETRTLSPITTNTPYSKEPEAESLHSKDQGSFQPQSFMQHGTGLPDIMEETESYNSGMDKGRNTSDNANPEDDATFNPRAISPMTLDTSFPSAFRNQKTSVNDYPHAESNTNENKGTNHSMPSTQTYRSEPVVEEESYGESYNDDATFNPRAISPMTVDTSFQSMLRHQKKSEKSVTASKASDSSRIPEGNHGIREDPDEADDQYTFNPRSISPMTMDTSLHKKKERTGNTNENVETRNDNGRIQNGNNNRRIQPINENDQDDYDQRRSTDQNQKTSYAETERVSEIKAKIDKISSHEKSLQENSFHERTPHDDSQQESSGHDRSYGSANERSQRSYGDSSNERTVMHSNEQGKNNSGQMDQYKNVDDQPSSYGSFQAVPQRKTLEGPPSSFRPSLLAAKRAGLGESMHSMSSLWNSGSSVYSNAIPQNLQQHESSDVYDLMIVGGGVVGLAVLRAATLSGYKTVLIEKEEDLLTGASAGNSGIIHTGTDSLPGSLERAMIRDSVSQIRPFLKKHKVPYHDCGSLVCQWDWDEVGRGKKYSSPLARVLAQSLEAGDTDACKLTQKQLLEAEPNMSPHCVGAVHIPGEMLVDPWLFCIAL